MKNEITFDEFLEIESKLDIRMGTVTSCERVPKSNKLLKLSVDFGKEERTVVTNIGDRMPDFNIINGEQYPFIMNLSPVKIMGIESTAMIMIAEHEGEIQPVVISNGSKLL